MPKPWTFNSPVGLYKDLQKLRKEQAEKEVQEKHLSKPEDDKWLKKAQEARAGGFVEPSVVEGIIAKFKY